MLSEVALACFLTLIWSRAADGLECYSCTNVTALNDCKQIVSCAQGTSCYMNLRRDGKVKHFALGCATASNCSALAHTSPSPTTGGPSIVVGRSITAYDSCTNCCNTGNCNRQLCQHAEPSCADNADCTSIGSIVNFCSDTRHAKQSCRRFCGLCSMIDGDWTSWTAWSPCDVTCGNGTHTRSRMCTDPEPADGGDDCLGQSLESETCQQAVCPVPGGWSPWSTWGSCSSSCDIGLQRRDRSCSMPYPSHNGDHCYGDSRDDRLCFPGPCADGGWSDWGSWGACSASCDYGTRTRTRACDNPTPSLVGKVCNGDPLQAESCYSKSCQDGHWSSWGSWSSCSRSCGDGYRSQSRLCNNPPPSVTGQYCAGDSYQAETCNVAKCPAKLSAFTASNTVVISDRWAVLIYNETKINEGQDYNPATGVFTCEHPGLYYFTVDLTKQRDYDNRVNKIYAFIRKNGQNVIATEINPTDGDVDKGSYAVTGSAVLHLAKGDTVDVHNYYRVEPWSSFSGFLFHPDP